MPNKVARVLYFSRSAFVLYSRTSSSREIVVDIVGLGRDLSSHCYHVHFIPRMPSQVELNSEFRWLRSEA